MRVKMRRVETLSQCVRSSEQGKQSRDADTTNKRERLTTNKLNSGSVHSVHESLADVLMSFHMLQVIPHVVGLVVLCAEISIHLLLVHQTYPLFNLYQNSLYRLTLFEKNHSEKLDV